MTTTLERELDVYRRHTPVTDPGLHADLFRALPTNPVELIEVVAGLVAHYRADFYKADIEPAPDRLFEVELRSARVMLERILEIEPAPLRVPRPLQLRLLTACLGVNLLLCSIFRTQGTPARLRYGFYHLFFQAKLPMHDHALVEYWSAGQQRWKYADVRWFSENIAHGHCPERYGDDVPEEAFLTGGQAWLHCQKGDAEAFWLSGYRFDADRGRKFAREAFMCDLASLCGWEPQLWDFWGHGLAPPQDEVAQRELGQLAVYDPRVPEQCLRLRTECAGLPLIRIPDRIVSRGPITGRHETTIR